MAKKGRPYWENYFPKEILRRGENYYDQGRVSSYTENINSCSADVIGSKPYHVRIMNPGQENMRMSCNCPHALEGHNCKHMAAVMFEWQAREDEANGVGQFNRSPFTNPEERKPFYDFEKITRSFRFKSSTVETARRMISEGNITLDDFTIYYDSYEVGSERSGSLAHITCRYHGKGYPAEMTMLISRDRVRRYDCGCCPDYYYGWYYNQEKEPCAHITALMMLADDYVRKADPGDYTDYNAALFLNAFGMENLKNSVTKAGFDEKCVQLEPKIVETATGMELNFRIGNGGKLYVVKNLTALHDQYHERKKMELGKSSSIDFAMETFDDNSEKLFALIEREVKRAKAVERKMDNRRGFNFAGSLETGKGVPLVGDAVDSIYDMYCGGIMECKFLEERKAYKLSVGEGSPSIDMKISPEYDPRDAKKEPIGVYVCGEVPRIVDGVRNQYFISRDRFGILDRELGGKLRPFATLAEENDGMFNFTVGKKRAAEFYYKVLPELMDDPVFNITEKGDITSLIKEKAEFTFFLDAEDGNILCKTEVAYGDEIFPLKGYEAELLPLQERRDFGQEIPVRECLDGMFEYYSIEDSAFVSEDSADARYEFLKHGVNRLLAYGEVNSTESFSRIQIRKLPVVQMGIRLESNLLNLTVQNQDMTSEELAELLQSYRLKKKYHRLRNGEYVDLETNESMETLMDLLERTGASVKDFVKGKLQLPAYRALYIEKMLEGHDELVSDRDRTYRNLIRNFKTIEDGDYDVPKSLQKVLRPYQTYGFKWMKALEAAGFGGILADDMGLGKTLQVISLILSDRESEGDDGACALVVCPASLVYNWVEETERFAPEMKAVAIAGTKKQRREILENHGNYNILITSYDLLKRDIDMYEDLQFSHQIIDEAQYIKNAGSAAAKSVKLIHASNRFALTGTPIENRLSELWSIFDYLMPGFLYGYERFRKTFELPISKNKDERQTEALKNMISPFLLRRKKADVLKDLPDKIEEMHYARFEGEQQKLYDAQVDKIRKFIESDDTEFDKSKIQILAELTKIRQICCDPSLIFEGYSGGSAKREACIDLIRSAIDGEHKVLLFSQFTSMLSLLEKDLKSSDIRYYKLTGATSKEDRMKMVKAFNSDDVPVFLISLKAGGTGLNLTGADIVVHYDPWWNRAAQDQATDRAHRIGQTKNVTVYQLIARDSIEERIVKLQNDKKELADAILAGESRSIGSMSREELMELLDF